MGAIYNEITLGDMTPADLRIEWMTVHDEACYNHGNAGYSGTFAETPGVEVTDKHFDTDAAARDFVESIHEKWDPAMAVRVKAPRRHWYIGAWCSS